MKTRVEAGKKKKKKKKLVAPFEHTQTARFKKIKPAHHHMFEGLFHHLFICLC